MYIWFMDAIAQKVVNWDFNPSHMLFYPDGMNFWASFEAPIILTVSTPVILLTHNPILAYNIILLLAFILTCYACYHLILYLTRSEYAALITGFSFGFSPYMLVRGTQHLDLVLLFCVPWAILNALKFLESPCRKNSWLLALSIFITALSAWYYLVGVLIFLCLMFVFNLRKSLESKRVYFATFCLVSLAVLLPALPMLLNRSELSVLYVEKVGQAYAADVLNFFIPHPYMHSWSWFIYNDFPSPFEATSYFGLVGLVAIVVMLFFSKKMLIPHRGMWMATILFFLLISLGIKINILGHNITMPFEFLNNFTPFDRLRAPNRLFILSYLATTVLFGYFLAYINDKFPNARWKITVTVFALAVLLSERYILSYPIFVPKVPEFYKTIGENQEQFAIADIPLIDPGLSLYNYYQIYHKKPIVDGEYFWTSYTDRTFKFILANPLLSNSIPCNGRTTAQGIDIKKTLKDLSDADIRYVVAHNFIAYDLKCPSINIFIREFFAGQKPVFSDGEISVYSTIDKQQQ